MDICPWQFLDLSLHEEDDLKVDILADPRYGKRLREMSGGGLYDSDEPNEDDIPLAKLKVTLQRLSPEHLQSEEERPQLEEPGRQPRENLINTVEPTLVSGGEITVIAQNSESRMVFAIMTPISGEPGQPRSLQPIGALIPVPEQSLKAAKLDPAAGFSNNTGGARGFVHDPSLAIPGLSLASNTFPIPGLMGLGVTPGAYISGFASQAHPFLLSGGGQVHETNFVNGSFIQSTDNLLFNRSGESGHPAYQLAESKRPGGRSGKKQEKHRKRSSSGIDPRSLRSSDLATLGKCPCCEDYFDFASLLFEHLSSNHPKVLQRAYCQICDHFFTSQSSLKYHQSKFHAVQGNAERCWCKHCSTVRSSITTPTYKAYCVVCARKEFINEDCYKNHILMHLHQHVAENRRLKREKNEFVRNEIETLEEKMKEKAEDIELAVLLSSFYKGKQNGFFCKRCNLGFAFAAMLLLHVRTVHCRR